MRNVRAAATSMLQWVVFVFSTLQTSSEAFLYLLGQQQPSIGHSISVAPTRRGTARLLHAKDDHSTASWHPQQQQLLFDNYPDHDYRLKLPRKSRDNHLEHLELIHYWIGERAYARSQGDFSRGQSIRRDILLDQYGVQLCDKSLTIRFVGPRRPAKAQIQNFSPPTPQHEKGRIAKRKTSSDESKAMDSNELEDGTCKSHEHPYELHPDAGPNQSGLSLSEIHKLLADRYRCKTVLRDFDRADTIQRQLIGRGIHVQDQNGDEGVDNVWRADGVPLRHIPHYIPRMDESKDVPAAAIPEITYLVQQRATYRSVRLFRDADVIQDQLWKEHNVLIHDQALEWWHCTSAVAAASSPSSRSSPPAATSPPRTPRASWSSSVTSFSKRKSSQQQPSSPVNRPSSSSSRRLPPVPLSYREVGRKGPPSPIIQKMVEKRAICRAERRFMDADVLLDELARLHNVRVDDRSQTYWWDVKQ